MTRGFKRALRWLVIVVGAMTVILVLAVGVLTTPGLFFPEERQYATITVHSETPIGRGIDSIMTEVLERLENVPIYNPQVRFDLCLCSTQDKFTFFARLTRQPDRIMGFCVLSSVYVNGDFIRDLAIRSAGRPKYSAREGSVVHVATHELMHGYLSEAYGYFASRCLPEWKVEGYCEYGVNQHTAPRDSGYTIPERIDIYLDHTQWNATAITHRPHYLWGLMMEYLINVKGMSLEQVMADSVTEDEVYREMMDWQKELSNGNHSGVGG